MTSLTSEPEVVFQPSEKFEWMSESVAFQKMVGNRLFFSGRSSSGRWGIGVADSQGEDLTEPRPIELKAKWALDETIAPNVVGLREGFIMAFAGRRKRSENRRLFIARSKSLDGPWEVEEQCYAPKEPWEGRNIDLGPGSLVKGDSVLFFYSTAFPRYSQIATAFLRRPHVPSTANLMRYEKRRIGILKVSISEPTTTMGSKHPIPLHSASRSAFESVFCPGYAEVDGRHFFFVACSNYSDGFPFRQSIGLVDSVLPPTEWTTAQEIRPLITSANLKEPLSTHSAFDSPDPVPAGGNTLRLYFSAMSRDVGRWSIMACDIGVEGV